MAAELQLPGAAAPQWLLPPAPGIALKLLLRVPPLLLLGARSIVYFLI